MDLKDIIYLSIAVVSSLFGLIMWVRTPQEKGETNDALFAQRLDNYEKNTNDAIKLALNHSHTVESKLDLHIAQSIQKGLDDSRWQGRIETLLEKLESKK